MEARNDDFHTPKPKKAGARAVVNAVLGTVSSLGTSLLSLLSGLLAAVLILYSGYVLYDTFYTQESAKSSWDLLQYKPVILENGEVPESVENLLSKINPDYRAWLTLYDTNIDYPVMQGENDLYYANHDIYKEVSLTGAIYLAAGNTANVSDSYNLIYGHHMDNGAMFGALDRFRDRSYFDAHREGLLVSRSAVYDLEAFAVVETDAYQSRIYTVGDRMGDVLAFLRGNVAGADPAGADWSNDTTTTILDEGTLTGATKIVALSTCAAANTNGRLVVLYTATQRNLITVNALGDTWVYDGQPHTLQDLSDDGSHVYYTTNYPGDAEYPTVVEYSIDGGQTWTTEPPTVTNVSESTDVIVRVTNEAYGRATTTVRLEATHKEVKVVADPGQQKTSGQGDPELTATPVGLVGNDSLVYTVTRPGAGTDEAAGTYPNAVVPAGDSVQGNYRVTYEPADFTILPAPNLRIHATGHRGVYDGKTYHVVATVNVTEGTVLQYSTDGGRTWTATAPSIRDVGEINVQVRATNANYVTDTVRVKLEIIPRPVVVAARPASKVFGTAEPTLTAIVTGLLNRDTIDYTVTRPDTATQTEVGVYHKAVVAAGAARQGNYAVTYLPADFTITPADQLAVNVSDYVGVYDGQSHQPVATVNIPGKTRIEYSTDNGQTWTTKAPSIRDVGEQKVLVRATNPNYETVTAEYTLKVTPAPVTVVAHDSSKIYGQADPAYRATVTGLLNDDTVTYTVSRPRAAEQQHAGVYPDAVVAQGEALQGNYEVTYVAGDFEILPSAGLTLRARGYIGVYDGEEHLVEAVTSTLFPQSDRNTFVEYSTDGGRTWSIEPPSIRDVGEQKVLVRATNPDYETVVTEVLLKVRPRQVTVTVGDYEKIAGADDPEFTATVRGLLDGDEIEYVISREEGEEPAAYPILAQGEQVQGNYEVTYRNGVLHIQEDPNQQVEPTPEPTVEPTPEPGVEPTSASTTAPASKPTAEPTAAPATVRTPEPTDGGIDIPDPEELDDTEPPLAKLFKVFEPKGVGGRAVWALVNLICLIITIYLFIPLMHLRAKFDRPRLMKKINENKRQLRIMTAVPEEEVQDKTRLEQLIQEARRKLAEAKLKAELGDAAEEEFATAVEELFYKVKRFLRRFRIGMVFELVFSVLALIAFILTEDMRLPMVLIDRWTPLMIVLMMIVWVLDVRLIRYREKVLADEEEAERKRKEREAAEAAK